MARPTAANEPMSAIDTAWLRMDRPTNLMTICAMILLDGPLQLERFKELVRTRLLCFHRFRQRVAWHGDDPHWELDPHFDLDWHVRRVAPGARERGAGLAQVAGELAGTALDPARPMWQFHLIDSAEGSAVVFRLHHCYCDGFALLHVVDTMTDPDPARPRRVACDVAPATRPRHAWERVLGPAGAVLGDTLHASFALAAAGRELLGHPLHALDYGKGCADLLVQAGKLASMAPDAPTALKGDLGGAKRVAWGAPLPLFEVKAIAQALSCSVNDVLAACAAGALRAWLEDQGEPVAGKEVRALVPVNLRPPGPITELGNQFGLVFLGLPVDIADPAQRLLEVHRRMEALKQSQQPLVAFAILAAMGTAPTSIKERLLEALSANASMVMTNVHGPDQPRYVAGRRIVREMFWVPQSGGIGLGISILSYNGEVNFGVVADSRRMPHPEELAARFVAEFEALVLAALLMPWPGSDG